MTSLLVSNIGRLVSWDDDAPSADAALVLDGGRVVWSGPSQQAPAADEVLDVAGRCVLPGFVDSHTHLVFAGDRVEEFTARSAGIPYSAGGIRTTVAATRLATTSDLLQSTKRLAHEALCTGTTTLEVKSGYGLTVDDERRCLQVAEQVTRHTTFLGAHVPEGDAESYTRLVAGDMLDACAPHATAIDAFCEEGAFDADQCGRVLRAGQDRGLAVHLHANQLRHGPGVQLAASLQAASADHCTYLTDDDITALKDADVTAVLVPAAEFSTRSPYAPARRLLDAGVTIALATDCNPGTSYTTSMPFVIALACRELGITPTEAVRAATQGGAKALRDDSVGQLRQGARADLVVLDAPSEDYLAYRPGAPLIQAVIKDGQRV